MLTREQLLKKKTEIDSALRVAKSNLKQAGREAKATGNYLPPEEIRKLEDIYHGLVRKAANVNAAVADSKHHQKQANIAEANTVDRRFIKIASRRLLPGLFKEIMDEAELG